MQQRCEVRYVTCTRFKEDFANTMLLLREFRGIAHTMLSAVRGIGSLNNLYLHHDHG